MENLCVFGLVGGEVARVCRDPVENVERVVRCFREGGASSRVEPVRLGDKRGEIGIVGESGREVGDAGAEGGEGIVPSPSWGGKPAVAKGSVGKCFSLL